MSLPLSVYMLLVGYRCMSCWPVEATASTDLDIGFLCAAYFTSQRNEMSLRHYESTAVLNCSPYISQVPYRFESLLMKMKLLYIIFCFQLFPLWGPQPITCLHLTLFSASSSLTPNNFMFSSSYIHLSTPINLWSSSRPPVGRIQPLHPSTDISTVPPLGHLSLASLPHPVHPGHCQRGAQHF